MQTATEQKEDDPRVSNTFEIAQVETISVNLDDSSQNDNVSEHYSKSISNPRSLDRYSVVDELEFRRKQLGHDGLIREIDLNEIRLSKAQEDRKYSDVMILEMKGYLKKKSPSIFKRWQNRYFVLKDRKLCYFTDDKMNKPKGFLNFDFVQAKVLYEPGSQRTNTIFTIYLNGSKRVFTLKAATAEEAEEWFVALKKAIEISRGHKKQLSIQSPLFWKRDRTSTDYLQQIANTGDILLFRGKQFGCKIQRSLTRSDYDHVAMLLRFNEKDLYVFEATTGEGVGVTKWETFLSYASTIFDKVVYRQLLLERDHAMMERLEKFVKDAYGNRYAFNPKKMLKRFSTAVKAHSKSVFLDDGRSFFCSELVAKSLKVMGLIDDKVSCTRFWPGSFSAEKKISMLKGELGPELVIDFSDS